MDDVMEDRRKPNPKPLMVMARYRRCRQLCVALLLVGTAADAFADAPKGMLETIRHHVTLTSTVTDNGDLNPYAIVVAPVSAGAIQKDDVLVDNFNNLSNLQGTGTTIVSTGFPQADRMFAKLPQKPPECPVGHLTTAMTMLKTGWVIVGSTPSPTAPPPPRATVV